MNAQQEAKYIECFKKAFYAHKPIDQMRAAREWFAESNDAAGVERMVRGIALIKHNRKLRRKGLID